MKTSRVFRGDGVELDPKTMKPLSTGATDNADSPTGAGTLDSSVSYSKPTMSELEDISLSQLLNDLLWKFGVWDDLTHDQHIQLTKTLKAYTDRAVTEARIDEVEGAKLQDWALPGDYLNERLAKLKALTISVRDGGETSSRRGKDNGGS